MRDFLAKQFNNKFLWVPFLLAFGAALYFAMPTEPHIKSTSLAMLACCIILVFGKLNLVLRGMMIFLTGFVYAAFYTHTIVSTPVLRYAVHDKNITATVTDLDISENKTRLVLNVPAGELGLGRNANVRVTIPDNTNTPEIGDVISGQASLFPPADLEAPGTFNYARWAFFNNLTANGFIDEYTVSNHTNSGVINRVRNIIHNKSNSFLTDGLVLGYKNSVPESDKQIWTAAGVGHIWAISGFHMTLIGGWLFAMFFVICRSWGFLSRRVPARISATICAWCILFAYVCISGFGVATLRAFLMTSLVFIALLLGRNAVSPRNICLVFLILFFINPHYVTQVGFQLSFAAIFGLVWFFDGKKFDGKTRIAKIKNGIYATIMTTIVATIFTLPFIAAHFNLVPTYGLIGNLILLPIFSVVIMPMVLIGTICAMFGEHILLDRAFDVYEFTLRIAQKIVDLPASGLVIPYVPDTALVVFILGLCGLIFIKPISNAAKWIYRNINYVIFTVCVIIGSLIVVMYNPPVFYTTNDHELIGMVYDGKLEFNKARASNHYFAFNAFRQLNNEAPAKTNIRRKCPDGVCIYKSDKWTVAYIQKFVPLRKHIIKLCRDDDIDFIVSYFDISAPKCNHKILHNGFVIYKSGRIKYTPFNRWWNNPHE